MTKSYYIPEEIFTKSFFRSKKSYFLALITRRKMKITNGRSIENVGVRESFFTFRRHKIARMLLHSQKIYSHFFHKFARECFSRCFSILMSTTRQIPSTVQLTTQKKPSKIIRDKCLDGDTIKTIRNSGIISHI